MKKSSLYKGTEHWKLHFLFFVKYAYLIELSGFAVPKALV